MKQVARIFIVIVLSSFPCLITAQTNTGGIENGFIFDEAENFIEVVTYLNNFLLKSHKI